MYVLTPGTPSHEMVLNDACKEVHNNYRTRIKQTIKDRKKNGVPLDDGDGDALELPGAYEEVAELDEIKVRLKTVSRKVFLEAMGRVQQAEADGWEGRNEMIDAMCLLVEHGVHSVKGLEGPNGPVDIDCNGTGKLSEEHLSTIEAAGLIVSLFGCVRELQELGSKKKRLFGLPPRQT